MRNLNLLIFSSKKRCTEILRINSITIKESKKVILLGITINKTLTKCIDFKDVKKLINFI